MIQNLRDLIDEIRIEGHTDSDGPPPPNNSYMYNMKLVTRARKSSFRFSNSLPELKK